MVSGSTGCALSPPRSHFLIPGSASAHPTPVLVVDDQGGITLGPEEGELGAVGETSTTRSPRILLFERKDDDVDEQCSRNPAENALRSYQPSHLLSLYS